MTGYTPRLFNKVELNDNGSPYVDGKAVDKGSLFLAILVHRSDILITDGLNPFKNTFPRPCSSITEVYFQALRRTAVKQHSLDKAMTKPRNVSIYHQASFCGDVWDL